MKPRLRWKKRLAKRYWGECSSLDQLFKSLEERFWVRIANKEFKDFRKPEQRPTATPSMKEIYGRET